MLMPGHDLFLCPLLIGSFSALARLAENIGKASVLLGIALIDE